MAIKDDLKNMHLDQSTNPDDATRAKFYETLPLQRNDLQTLNVVDFIAEWPVIKNAYCMESHYDWLTGLKSSLYDERIRDGYGVKLYR